MGKNIYKSTLIFFIGVVLSNIICGCFEDRKEKKVTEALRELVVEAEIPLLQIEYHSPHWTYFAQIEKDLCITGAENEDVAVGLINNKGIKPASAGKTALFPEGAVFQAASLSKVVFAYIVMKMCDKGEIDLNTPLYKYFEREGKSGIDRFENQEYAKMITAQMVLRHRTGLPNWSTSPSSEEWPLSTIVFKHHPDSAFGYSGEGFAYLQRAVECIKGDDIEHIAIEEVFIPLGMEHTSYQWISSYDSLNVCGNPFPRANTAYTLRTTAHDYSKFLSALLEGKGLSKKMHEMFFTPDATNAVRYCDNKRECDSTIFWGLGLGIEKNPNFGNVIWHWGDNGKYKSLFILIPSTGESLVYFANNSTAHSIIDKITPLFFESTDPFALSEWINEES